MARRTKAEAAATRETLIDAAEEMFMEHGVARTSLEQIARHAGMTRGAVYWHFKNKADLFRAMLERVRMPFDELVREIDDPALTESPLNAIRLACLKGLARLEQPRYTRVHSILLYRCEFFSDIDPIAMQEEIACDVQEALLNYFSLAEQRQELSVPPEVAAELMNTCLSGLFHDWLRKPEAYSIFKRGEALIANLLELMTRRQTA
jgi:TetR/AcrR family acrAB operon transcriptional repressor